MCYFRRTVLAVVAAAVEVALFAAPAPARVGYHTCAPATGETATYETAMYVKNGTRCTTAQAVDRYVATHDLDDVRSFRVAGHVWHYAIVADSWVAGMRMTCWTGRDSRTSPTLYIHYERPAG